MKSGLKIWQWLKLFIVIFLVPPMFICAFLIYIRQGESVRHLLSSVALEAMQKSLASAQSSSFKSLSPEDTLSCFCPHPPVWVFFTASGKDSNSIQLDVHNFTCFESTYLQMRP